MPTLLLLLLLAAPGDAWFYPGAGPETVAIDAHSAIDGMRVERTGAILARVDDPDALRGLAGVASVTVLRGDGHVVRVVPSDGVDEIALSRDLHDRDDVTWCHPDLVIPAVLHALPDDPFVGDQWHLSNEGQGGWTPGADINADQAWELTTGEGALIAVLDSGTDTEHPDLAVINGHDYIGDDEDSNPDVSTEEAPHGTCTAGIAAARGDNGIGVAGVAYDAEIYGIRLIGDGGSLEDIYEAFVEAVDAGAWVLSNSWGFGDDCPEFPTYAVFEEAMAYAETVGRGGLGTAVVASAGNGNCDISGDGFQALPQVISVAASSGHDVRESYSSFGDHIDLTAPSGSIVTTDITGDEGYGSHRGDPDYIGSFSGTSASCPMVSGAVALLFAANPRMTPADALDVLCATANRIDVDGGEYDADGWSPYYGCGRIDVGAAVRAAANAAPAAPALVAPLERAWPDRVVLEWSPAEDADGDWLQYEVSWWVDAGDGGENGADGADGDEAPAGEGTVTQVVTETHLEITGAVALGDEVRWQVRAVDRWGYGAASDTASFVVSWYPPQAGESPAGGSGCAVVPRDAGAVPPSLVLASLLLAGIGLARRRSS